MSQHATVDIDDVYGEEGDLYVYTAYCPDCKWEGIGFDLESYAEEEASRHDRDNHGAP